MKQDQTGVVIALAGNPNSGKTSLFNHITGKHQHVANYPGVTVEKKEGAVPVDDVIVTFVDLPGTYSLTPYTMEEKLARREIMSSHIDCIIAVVDSARLERNLYFVAQLIETGKPVVLALNMFDELESSGGCLDVEQLSRILGIPCVKTIGNRGKGVTELVSTALKAARGEIEAHGKYPRYSHEMEHALDEILCATEGKTPYNSRWTAINLLAYGADLGFDETPLYFDNSMDKKVRYIRTKLEQLEGLPVQSIITAGRYGFSSGAVTECLKNTGFKSASTTDKIDTVLTGRWLGIPIFLLVFWLMFQATFILGQYPMEMISRFFELLSATVSHILPEGFVRSLITEGIIAGVGGVLIFLPNILILFLFISILEDTGYMARTAFIMDKVMHFFGLHGKSFLPMLVGFGCSVPAIMATRILENRRDRLVTMFIIPFMSCGAKLPVYVLLAGAFFSPGAAGNVVFSIYLVGILLGLFFAKIINIMSPSSVPFVMELPPYRIPTLRSVVLHIWERIYLYFKKAGTTILIISIAVWFCVSFPKKNDTETMAGTKRLSGIENTYAGKFGKFIEPALQPLGLDWRIGLSLTAGLAAKEVIISTLGTIYAVKETDDSLETGLQNELRKDPLMNPVKAYGLLLFILIYVPCAATLNIVKKEAGGWRWALLMAFYTTTIAWVISFLFIKIATHINLFT